MKIFGQFAMLSGLLITLSACQSQPTMEIPMNNDEAFCLHQGGEYLDSAYPACRLPDGTELDSNEFYQKEVN